jgi:hypothetical protein
MPHLIQPTSSHNARHVILPSHWAKTTSPPSLHISIMLCLVASPLEAKLKYWIRTAVVGYPLQTTWLSPFTTIKNHLNLDHSSHHSTVSPLCILPSQSTTSSELHPPSSFPFTVGCLTPIISPHNNTHGDELVGPFSLFEQLINMWIHIKRYFKMLQHRTGL